jgi:hypothetical protein
LAESPHSEIERFLLIKHAHFVRIEKLLKIFVTRILLDPGARERMDVAAVARSVEVLGKRLAAHKKRGLIKADVDLRQLALMIVCQPVSLSFLYRTTGATSEEEVVSTLKAFAANIARGVETGSR